MENLNNDDNPTNNMLAASEWLNSIPQNDFSSLPIALRLLTSLKDLHGAADCDGHSMEMMAGLERAVKGNMAGKRPRMYRLETVIDHYFEQHARDCIKIYPSVYKNKADQLDETTNKNVDELFEHVAKWYFNDEIEELQTSGGLFEHFMRHYHEFEGRIAYNIIMKRVGGDVRHSDIVTNTDGRLDLHGDKLRKLYQSNIVDPCQRYTALLGSDVFEPAAFDHYKLNYKQLDDKNIDFYRAWAKYQVCNLVVSDEEKWADALIGVTRRIIENLRQ